MQYNLHYIKPFVNPSDLIENNIKTPPIMYLRLKSRKITQLLKISQLCVRYIFTFFYLYFYIY